MFTRYFDLRDTKGQQKWIEDQVAQVADILRQGGLAAFPTETVYGLGANALDPAAVEKVFAVKGRPLDNPLILHVPGVQWLPRYCRDVSPLAYTLARKFWPGPLTLVLRRRESVPAETAAGLDTVAVRCPDHPVALAIIREASVPLAAPSANRSGRPSCTTADAVLEDMDGRIDAVVDGGPCQVGVESTVLDMTVHPPRLLRPGGLPLEALEEVAGPVTVDGDLGRALAEGAQPRSPGMKYRHYAPKAPVTVVTGPPEDSAQTIAAVAKPGDGVLCFEEFVPLFSRQRVESLGPSQNLRLQAQRMFEALRAFDRTDVARIYAQSPGEQGLGLAISNRLQKASGFQTLPSAERKLVVGITGGSGAGKTSALEVFGQLGGTVLDCDAIYHQMLREEPALRQAVSQAFPGVFRQDGTLDRRRLAAIVFEKRERLEQLNEIVYRFLYPEIRRRCCTAQGPVAVDAVNLLDSGLDQLCTCTVAVTAPQELRLKRIMKRDGITQQAARSRMKAQRSEEYYRSRCDHVLCNTAQTAQKFQTMARIFFEKLLSQTGSHGEDPAG